MIKGLRSKLRVFSLLTILVLLMGPGVLAEPVMISAIAVATKPKTTTSKQVDTKPKQASSSNWFSCFGCGSKDNVVVPEKIQKNERLII